MKAKALIAEFVGTFALIFIGVSAIASNYMIDGGKTTDIVAIALAHGLTIAVMVTATATVSGGHLNPAVTFGVWVVCKIDGWNASRYILFQCLGGIFAASLSGQASFSRRGSASNIHGNTNSWQRHYPNHGLCDGVCPLSHFFLVFAVFATAINPRAPKIGGLFIGLTVGVGYLGWRFD